MITSFKQYIYAFGICLAVLGLVILFLRFSKKMNSCVVTNACGSYTGTIVCDGNICTCSGPNIFVPPALEEGLPCTIGQGNCEAQGTVDSCGNCVNIAAPSGGGPYCPTPGCGVDNGCGQACGTYVPSMCGACTPYCSDADEEVNQSVETDQCRFSGVPDGCGGKCAVIPGCKG